MPESRVAAVQIEAHNAKARFGYHIEEGEESQNTSPRGKGIINPRMLGYLLQIVSGVDSV